MRQIEDFVKLSKYAGERFDLVQGGGGNSSVKLGKSVMLIKASGFMLSEVEADHGWARVRYPQVLSILNNKKILLGKNRPRRERLAGLLLKETCQDSVKRPSIETFLHAMTGYAYTLHIHPVVVNALTCRFDWSRILASLFGGGQAAYVDYGAPGIELALALKKVIGAHFGRYHKKPRVIFMQNHGLIVAHDQVQELIRAMEDVIKKIENYLKIDLDRYKMTNRVSAFVNSLKQTNFISYMSCDEDLNSFLKMDRKLLLSSPFCPDGLVYCGEKPLEVKSLADDRSLKRYYARFSTLPKVIIHQGRIFFISENLKKIRSMEDTFKFHLMALKFARGKVKFLGRNELKYLSGLETEKYRQKI